MRKREHRYREALERIASGEHVQACCKDPCECGRLIAGAALIQIRADYPPSPARKLGTFGLSGNLKILPEERGAPSRRGRFNLLKGPVDFYDDSDNKPTRTLVEHTEHVWRRGSHDQADFCELCGIERT